MSLKKRTYKQRARRNEMKERHKVSADLRKRMRAARRRHNRQDDVDDGSKPLEELVEEVSRGFAAPAQEVALDPRSLTDLLLTHPAKEKGKNMEKDGKGGHLLLPTGPLSKDHPLALPEINANDGSGFYCGSEGGAPSGSKNHYRHHGDPFLFWERLGLHPLLLKALQTMRFTHPTPVQEEVLPVVIQHAKGEATATLSSLSKKSGSKKQCWGEKDVIISAETGSGKTLAFALPILHRILTSLPVTDHKPATSSGFAEEEKEEGENEEVDKGGGASVKKKEKGHNKKRKVEPDKDALFKETDCFERKTSEENMSKIKNRKRAREIFDNNDDAEELANSTAAPNTMFRERIMQALVISPTRELALQINQAFLQLTQHARHVVIGCVVGGMAPEKQQRVLNRHPHVLICTPGRLWELVQNNEGCYLGHSISRRLGFVVLDEADKLLQSGRFEEVKSLLERIHCEILPAGFVQEREEGAEVGEMELEAGRWDEKKGKFISFSKEDVASERQQDVLQKRQRKDVPRPIPMPPNPPHGHRTVTFVTSATLSLQTKYERKDLRSKKTVIRTFNTDTMTSVLQQLEIKPSNAHTFTISSKVDVVANIQETYLRCPGDSKDLYLYYFLKMYRERTIVFVNAISMLRRLVKLLEVFGIPVAGIHASLQQRQRLKCIDRFRKGEKRVLVATDVASRGLDIEGVKYIVHFQLPRTTDAYIHRCGRTARCGGTGLSVLMLNAQEHVAFNKLMASLDRKPNDIEMFALRPTIVHQLHSHMKIALQIDKLQKEIDKSRAQNNWVRRASREADIDVDDMIDDEADNENRAKEKAIKLLRKRLELLIKKDMGTAGGKGGFRTSAQALGAREAESKLVERANMQVTQKKKNIKKRRRS